MPPKTPQWQTAYPDPDYQFPWEDLRAPASTIRVGASAPADLDDDGGLLFASNATETASLLMQVPHGWWQGSTVHPHVHWSKTSDASGDVVWQIRYRVFSIGIVVTAWSEWAARTDRSNVPGSTQMHVLDEFADIDMSDETVSCIMSFQIRRKHDATDDDYAADAKMWEFDVHYRADSIGSIEEYTKSVKENP